MASRSDLRPRGYDSTEGRGKGVGRRGAKSRGGCAAFAGNMRIPGMREDPRGGILGCRGFRAGKEKGNAGDFRAR